VKNGAIRHVASKAFSARTKLSNRVHPSVKFNCFHKTIDQVLRSSFAKCRNLFFRYQRTEDVHVLSFVSFSVAFPAIKPKNEDLVRTKQT
jgi:hypothetical protein